MLRILGRGSTLCDRVPRREALRVGGLALLSGATWPQRVPAAAALPASHSGAAKSVILINLFGGPPHQDLFDLKPDAPKEVRGEFSPISTSIPGVQIGELLPEIAQVMDRCTLIRTYSHKYNSHNPYNVFTGFDGGNDRENYFAKRSDHPSIASVCMSVRPPSGDIPPYVILPAYPGYSQALRRSGPYGAYLGSQYDPLFTLWDPQFPGKSKDFYEHFTAQGQPVLPSLDGLPNITADRLDRRQTLLEQIDRQTAALERSRVVEGMAHFQRQVFTLLTSPKTRSAFDLSRESDVSRDRYGRHLWGSSLLLCRRLVEAGSLFVSVNWEADNGNHWDLHENNFGMCRAQAPILDQMVSALILDLEARGMLETTLVIVMGEMGRSPRINAKAGRDHWPQCGFALLAGGGMKRGLVVGKTDGQAGYPIERPVSAGDLASTIYHLLGIDYNLTVNDLTDRPNHISHGGEPVWEALA